MRLRAVPGASLGAPLGSKKCSLSAAQNFSGHKKYFLSAAQNFLSSWGHLGHLGAVLGHLGPSWDRPWGDLAHPGPTWRRLGSILGPSWAILGPPWAILGPPWPGLALPGAVLGPSWPHPGPSLAILSGPGPILGPSWDHLGPSWDHLGPSWVVSGPSWDHLGAILGPGTSLEPTRDPPGTALAPQNLKKPGKLAIFRYCWRAARDHPGPSGAMLRPSRDRPQKKLGN